uniref:Uncharacterized protein n=1 Tax=Panagrolaimus sp. PS1159 TaxID=55785 RepID=A0AC35F6B2_9BILA
MSKTLILSDPPPVYTSLSESPSFDENPRYRTICGNHVTSATKFICILSIVGLCISSIGSFPYGLIITVPLIIAFYVPFNGIKELQSGKLVPILIISGFNLVMSIASLVYIAATFFFDVIDRRNLYGTKHDKSFIELVLFLLVLQLLWNGWCFAVILRCYEYIKTMKMAQTKQAQMI